MMYAYQIQRFGLVCDCHVNDRLFLPLAELGYVGWSLGLVRKEATIKVVLLHLWVLPEHFDELLVILAIVVELGGRKLEHSQMLGRRDHGFQLLEGNALGTIDVNL